MSLDFSLIETSPHEVYSANVTHNLMKLATAAGICKYLWYPKETEIKTAGELAEKLRAAIADMEDRPDYYKQFDPPNKWGSYEGFIPWLKSLLAACEEHPNASLKAWI